MSASSFGHVFKLCGFGESHGPAMGAVIEGCPAGAAFPFELLKRELRRRRPGDQPWTSARKEPDQPEVLSGVYEGKTLGTPIAVLVRSKDARSQDYPPPEKPARRGRADDLWKEKFGHFDHRGGGRSSGRETLSRVLGGAVARGILQELCPELKVMAFARQIGPLSLKDSELKAAEELFRSGGLADEFPARLPHREKSGQAKELLMRAKSDGESFGSIVELWLEGLPKGLGQPVFKKLESDLTGGLMSLGAACGLELGAGFAAAPAKGSAFHSGAEKGGGVRGGLSTGGRISIKTAFKPPSSFGDFAKKGRHDPCIGPRAVPVAEAMACLVILDHLLWRRLDRLHESHS